MLMTEVLKTFIYPVFDKIKAISDIKNMVQDTMVWTKVSSDVKKVNACHIFNQYVILHLHICMTKMDIRVAACNFFVI